MGTINRWHARYHYPVIVCLLWCGIIQAKEVIQLQKILFNHVPEVTKLKDSSTSLKDPRIKDTRIELGSLTLYFSERPTLNTLPQNDKTMNQVVFFLPHVEMKDSALKKKVERVNRDKTSPFKILFKETKYPVKGMTLTFSFDPAKVAYSYDTFDSISMRPGVVFTFYNRELIQTLSKKSSGKRLLRMACSEKKKTVVIDCGHGGVDKGAAPFKGIEEKNITLAVGLKVADLLKKKGIDVVLTRSRDITRSLDYRASVALKVEPSLFVSIHANSSIKRLAEGIETFHIHPPLLSRVSDTMVLNERSLVDTFFNHRCCLSAESAQAIHAGVMSAATLKHPSVCNRGIKQSLAYVLFGSRVPAVLVEMGFVSNPHESRLLISRQYQEDLAKGLSKGILTALDRIALQGD